MLTTLMTAVAVLALLFVMMSVKIVHQGYRYTIEHFGRFVRVAQPGFNFVPPFFYRVGHKINMMEQVLDVPRQEVITKDNAMVSVDGVVFYQVLDAAKAAYEVNNLENAILNLTMTNIRTVMGSMDLDETLSKRDEINARLLAVVDHATEAWGVKITRVELKDIRPPADIVNAMTRMRFCDRQGRIDLQGKGTEPANGYLRWYETRPPGTRTLIFGHWSQLGLVLHRAAVGLDSGCVWGRKAGPANASTPPDQSHETTGLMTPPSSAARWSPRWRSGRCARRAAGSRTTWR